MTREMLTTEDVARITRLSVDTVRAAVRDGELQATRLRRRILISQEQLADWIDEGRVQPGAQLEAVPFTAPRSRSDHPGSPREAMRRLNQREQAA